MADSTEEPPLNEAPPAEDYAHDDGHNTTRTDTSVDGTPRDDYTRNETSRDDNRSRQDDQPPPSGDDASGGIQTGVVKTWRSDKGE